MSSNQNDPSAVTDRQREIMQFIRDHIAEVGYPPSVREIGNFVIASISTVHADLGELEEHGLLRRTSNRSRAIVVVDEGAAA